jgi:hypothetical protein
VTYDLGRLDDFAHLVYGGRAWRPGGPPAGLPRAGRIARHGRDQQTIGHAQSKTRGHGCPSLARPRAAPLPDRGGAGLGRPRRPDCARGGRRRFTPCRFPSPTATSVRPGTRWPSATTWATPSSAPKRCLTSS